MHEHRNAPLPPGVGEGNTTAFDHQRRLVQEVAICAPAEGDDVRELAARLYLSEAQIEAAAAVLESVGLVERRDVRLFATPALVTIEHLWPLG
jgi:hypothetical protein